jgi:hypothetical protein
MLVAVLQGGNVEVTVNTLEPYQHCLTVQQPSSSSSSSGEASDTASVVVQGLTFSHYSKSVADNYAVFVQVSGIWCVPQEAATAAEAEAAAECAVAVEFYTEVGRRGYTACIAQ